jgi:hypothetical protein
MPVLFWANNGEDIPFDVFAASFFMISRYEEYLPQQKDKFDRIIAENSNAYIHNFLHISVVDHWALILRKEIEKLYPSLIFPVRKFTYIPTIDVDIAYAYKFRNHIRLTGATVRSIIKGDFKDNHRRYRTLLRNDRDPYDTFDIITDLCYEYGFDPTFFFLLGRYGRFDKNISADTIELHGLIKKIHIKYKVGIHPSYGSNLNDNLLQNEINILEKITGQAVTKSRQHFLKIKLPETYQKLIACGIREDYTMGYASQVGFRAGTSTPFQFYDLSTEKETFLKVYPFQVMDGTLNQYLGLTPNEAISIIVKIINEIKLVNGTFISLWHNESLSEIREWIGWREVYYSMTKQAISICP